MDQLSKMKAVILAAGEGTRLEPLTNLRPKPMVPVANRPLLEHVVEAVADAGISEIVLVVGYRRERIQNYFGDGDDWGVDVEYAVQEKQLGTGDAVLQAEPFVDDDFVVLNGDRAIEADLIEAVVDERSATADPTMSVTRVDEPRLYGVVETDGGRVTSLTEKPERGVTDSELINAGVYGFGPSVFDAIRATDPDGELALTATIERLLEEGPVRAVNHRGAWLDVTRPWDLLTVNGRLIDVEGPTWADSATGVDVANVSEKTVIGDNVTVQPGAVVLRGTALGDNVTVKPNAYVENSVLLPDVTVGPGAVLKDCIVGANATVGPNTTVEGGESTVVLGDAVHHEVRFGGIVGDNTTLAANVSVEPGTVVGNDVTVTSGCVVGDRVGSGVEVHRG
jgi:NDP-sugar pyrophosphorylase family protein